MANSAVVGILRVLLTANAAEFETDMKRVSSAVDQTAKTLMGLDKAGMNIGMRMQSLGKGLTTALTLPLAAVGAGSAKLAIDFESSFAGVRKTVDATEAEFAALAQSFRNLSKEIPINVNELNKIGEAAGQLGIEKEAIVGFTEVMAKLGVTTNLTSDQAASSLARLANITQMPQTEFERLGSTVVGLGNNFATTEAEIVDFGLRIAGAGKQAGISEAGILAIGTAMSSVGVQAEAGGTAVQKVLLEMVKASAQGADGFATFAKTAGMSAQEFATLFEKDAATAFRLFVEGLGREGKNAINILSELGLEDQRLIRSFLALSGAGDLLERTLNEANTAWRENTALTEEARKRFATTESQLILLWGRIKDVGITIGNALKPAIDLAIRGTTALLPIIESLGKGFAALPTPVQGLAIGLGLVAAAAGPLLYVTGQLVMAAGALSGLLATGLNPALAMSAGHHHKAAAAATVNATETTAAGVAATGASTAFKLLATQALAAFVIFESLPRILKAVGIGLDMLADKADRDKGVVLEQARRYQMRAAASKIAGRAILDYDEAVEIVIRHDRELADSLAGTGEALGAVGPAADDAAAAAKTYAAQLEAAQQLVAALTKEQRANIVAGDKMGASNKEIAQSLKLTGVSAEVAEAAVKLYLDSVRDGGKAIEDAAEFTERWEESKRKSREELMRMDVWLTRFNANLGVTGDDLLRTTAAMMKLGQVTSRMPIIAKDFGGDLAKMIAPLKEAVTEQGPLWGFELGEGVVKGLTSVFENIGNTFSSAFTGGGGLGGAFKALGVQLADSILKPLIQQINTYFPRIGQAIGVGTAAAGALGSAFGTTASIIGTTASAVGGIAIAASGATMSMAALGAATAGIGAAAVGVFLLVKHLSGIPKDVKEARKQLESFNAELENVATQEQLAESGGQKWALSLILVRDSLMDLGVPLDEAVAQSNALVAALLNTDNPQVMRGAIVAITALINKAKEARVAAGALFEEIMEFAGTTGGVPQAMRGMIDQFIELGLLTDDQAAKLRGLADSSALDWRQMQEDVELFKGRIDQLGPAFQQARLDETSNKYINAIDRLMRAPGANVGAILFDAREELGALAEDAMRTGSLLPAQMRPWIDELFRTNQLLDKNGDAITDISGLQYGEAMKTEAEIAAEGWAMMAEKIQALIDLMAELARAQRDVDREPGRPDRSDRGIVEGETNTTLPIRPGTRPREVPDRGFASGTMGRFGRWIQDFGPSFTTDLHGPEVVAPAAQLPRLFGDMLGSALTNLTAPSLPALSTAAPMALSPGATENGSAPPFVAFAPIVLRDPRDVDRALDEWERNFPTALAGNKHGMRVALTKILQGRS